MGKTTSIQWCDHTFNPWRGCARVAAGCENCYAEAFSRRNPAILGTWGVAAKGGVRVLASDDMWRDPIRWNATAQKKGRRRRVFCGSLMDVFESFEGPVHQGGHVLADYDLDEARNRLFRLIRETPWLDWLLLTKRPEVAEEWLQTEYERPAAVPNAVGDPGYGTVAEPYPNLWLGYSASTQPDLDRGVRHLLRCPAAVRFLSLEPLVGPIRFPYGVLDGCLFCCNKDRCDNKHECTVNHHYRPECPVCQGTGRGPNIHWVIVGGESGIGARPCWFEWLRSVRNQCQVASVPVFVKQLGAKPFGVWGFGEPPTETIEWHTRGGGWRKDTRLAQYQNGRWKLRDKKGGAIDEWPEDLRVREFPRMEVAT